MLIREMVYLKDQEIVMDLVIIDMLNFDVILGMDFLARYRVKLIVKRKRSNLV